MVKAMTYLRNKGVCADRELLTALGRQTISKCRNIPMDKVQELSEHWVKSMRHRHKFTRSVSHCHSHCIFLYFTQVTPCHH